MASEAEILYFDAYVLDVANRQLARSGEPVELGSRYFDALVLLVQARGELVTKERFMDIVWRGIPVTDEALTQCVRTLRRTLADDASASRFIETVPKHGYRFISEVRVENPETPRAEVQGASKHASRLAGAATLGGGVAGMAGGFAYGLVSSGEGGTGLLLGLLAACLGVVGGAGIGLGLSLAQSWRPNRSAWLILGAGMGGLLAGGIGKVLSLDGIALLTGQALGHVTGLFEGLVLGMASGIGAALVQRALGKMVLCAGTIASGIAAGAVITFTQGRLFAGSFYELQSRFDQSYRLFDRPGWETVLFESVLFTACVTIAIFLAARPKGRRITRSGTQT